MIAAPVPDHVRQNNWRKWREEKYERALQKHENRNRIRGVDLVVRLEDGRRRIEFMRRLYNSPPVPWHVAPLVLRAQQQWDALRNQPESPEWPALYAEVARLFKLVCFPVERLRRLFWRFIPSPLRNASHLEVAHALGFFSTFRRLDQGESPSEILASLRPETSRPTSAGSPVTSGRGATNGATP